MTETSGHKPEIIESANVIPRGNVRDVEGFRTTWSIALSAASLAVGVAFLGVAIALNRTELVTWSTGLISAIAGSAISYGFTGKGR